jgi:hypothetical protein
VLLKNELGFEKASEFFRCLTKHATSAATPRDAEQGRAAMAAIIERAMRRLSERATEHEQHAGSPEARAELERAFESTPRAQNMNYWERRYLRTVREGVEDLERRGPTGEMLRDVRRAERRARHASGKKTAATKTEQCDDCRSYR